MLDRVFTVEQQVKLTQITTEEIAGKFYKGCEDLNSRTLNNIDKILKHV